jgi:hypothetical protein
MNVKEKFIELTKFTYPHGTEMELVDKLPNYLKQDEFGNLYHQIGDNPTTMFTSHLDTASYTQEEVFHVVKDNMIYSDGSTILGADDKAGVVVLLHLMENNIPGLYYFFLGEERGCIGSKKTSDLHHKNPLPNITKVVSFDRRGTDSVITHQLSGRCCSEDFAKDLSYQLNKESNKLFDKKFNYQPDPTGIYTDSAQFTHIYAECTNISVGYQNEHTKYESQDIEHLQRLCEVVVRINWDNLTVSRDPKQKYSYNDHLWDDEIYYPRPKTYNSYTHSINENVTTELTILDTEFFGHETRVKYDYNTYEILEVKPHPGRIIKERQKIEHLLDSLEVDYYGTKWDGNTLTIQNINEKDYTLSRNDIAEYLTDFNDWIEVEIKYYNIS